MTDTLGFNTVGISGFRMAPKESRQNVEVYQSLQKGGSRFSKLNNSAVTIPKMWIFATLLPAWKFQVDTGLKSLDSDLFENALP